MEISISTKACRFNRAKTSVFLLEIARFSFEYERFGDGFYLRLNHREWSVWS